MIQEEQLVQEFVTAIEQLHPQAGELLGQCYVKVITSYWGRPPRQLQYIGIYCPESVLEAVQAQKAALRETAKFMGLVEVVCLNATRLLRDPMSKLKQADPRFWLELYWVATHKRGYSL
jgi:hypothetical protein